MTIDPERPVSPAPRHLWWGAAGAAVLMVAGGVAFAFASMRAAENAAPASEATTVTLRDGVCEPNALSVPAGRALFRIVNATDRAVEWEILDGVMVVEERENIAPGLTQTLGARLRPGEYAITCGLLSNPRGTLTVTASEAGTVDDRPALLALIAPLAEYQVYLALQGNAVVKGAEALDAAIAGGDLEAARTAYAAARAPYLRIAPVAARFADLDNSLDPVAAYLKRREDDPAFTGYHRIEHALFARESLDGLRPVSQRLVADAEALRDRLRTVTLGPDDMGGGAVKLLRLMAETQVPAGESVYSGADLADFEAEMVGVRKIATLLRPVGAERSAETVAAVEARLASVDAALVAQKGPDGYPAYPTVAADAKARLAGEIGALAEAMERMNAALGLVEGGA